MLDKGILALLRNRCRRPDFAIWRWLLPMFLFYTTNAYRHPDCTTRRQAQFQYPDCYIPPMRTDIPFTQASFLFSHDAATGYIQPAGSDAVIHSKSATTSSSSSSTASTPNTAAASWSWWYSKNQVGSIYQQLNDGARALDLRPHLYKNGTVIFHHGVIRIPTTLTNVVTQTKQWCMEHGNTDELVLILLSHFSYDNYDENDGTDMVSAVSSVLTSLGVAYVDCTAVYDLTVGQVMELAALENGSGGHLLVLDGHDTYGTSCAKENWVESQIVTCYPKNTKTTCLSKNSNSKTKSDLFESQLRPYLLASANNAATDNAGMLGPPLSLYDTPFNEIQALWQVTASSALYGMEHFSSILHDNVASHINERVMNMVHDNEFKAISLLAVDNVAQYGNALLSVLRTTCGQSMNETTGNALSPCGAQLAPPPLSYRAPILSRRHGFFLVVVLYLGWIVYSVVYHQRPRALFGLWAWWDSNHQQAKTFKGKADGATSFSFKTQGLLT